MVYHASRKPPARVRGQKTVKRHNHILGYRLMVGHQVLVLSIEVRVLVSQLEKNTAFWLCFSLELG